MKARPRSVERRAAEVLSEWFQSLGFSSVDRVPVLGRTGPDIEINELGLVIDVKSRLHVPKSYLIPTSEIWQFGFHVGVRLKDLNLLLGRGDRRYQKTSRQVEWWFAHMDEWRCNNEPDGITAIILHRPRVRIANATFLMDGSYVDRLRERALQQYLERFHGYAITSR